MASRIGNHIDFPNYEIEELVSIAKVCCGMVGGLDNKLKSHKTHTHMPTPSPSPSGDDP